MYKVLFMPLLQIPSGHHHAADSIQEQLLQSNKNYRCEKVEIISHCYGRWEALISSIYLHWIHKYPTNYSKIYKRNAVNGVSKRFYTYEKLFLKKVYRLLISFDPNIVICTHALPSYLLSQLKNNHQWEGKVVNVYTDYFINDLWGIENIDFHFVPSFHMKQQLLRKGVHNKQIFVTGIPIHPAFQQANKKKHNKDRLTILISGGNMGVGPIEKLLTRLHPSGDVLYKVLCGKNLKLYHSVKKMGNPYIQPLPYISSKDKMNQLYDEADAIITKPGGVTISECLWKKLPIFVYEALPGQEEFNFHYLKKQGLIFDVISRGPALNMETFIIDTLDKKLPKLEDHFNSFYHDFEQRKIPMIIEEILNDS